MSFLNVCFQDLAVIIIILLIILDYLFSCNSYHYGTSQSKNKATRRAVVVGVHCSRTCRRFEQLQMTETLSVIGNASVAREWPASDSEKP